MKWNTKNSAPDPDESASTGSGDRPIMIHALDGFLGAGSATRLAADQLRSGGPVVHEFDIDDMFDYRARRPMITFDADHYRDYDTPRLDIRREVDAAGTEFYVLSGPEPDFRWEAFAEETMEVIDDLGIGLVLGLGSVPMGVPRQFAKVVDK